MKKNKIVTLIFCLFAINGVNAQWTSSTFPTDVNSNLYRQGKVGIGTTNPQTPLEVSGIGTTLIRNRDNNPAGIVPGALNIFKENTDGVINTVLNLGNYWNSQSQSNSILAIDFRSGDGNGVHGTAAAPGARIKVQTSWEPTYMAFDIEGISVMRLQSGTVGIGTTPLAQVKLHVKETGNSGVTWRGRIVASGDNQAIVMGEYNNQAWLGGHNAALNAWTDLFLAPGGNIAVGGITTPQAKLQVSGSGNQNKDLIVNGRIQTGDANNNGGLWVGSDDKTFVGRANANIGLFNNGFWRMIVAPDGNVGIGSNFFTPQAQLHLADIYAAGGKNLLVGDDAYLTDIDQTNTLGIYGNVNSDRAGIKLGSSGPTLFGSNDGKVGIGTTSPGGLLSIYGINQPSVDINSSSGGLRLGVSTGGNYPMYPVVAGDACIQTGANNLFIGNTAGGKSIKFLTSRASNNYQFVAMEILGSGQIAMYNTNYGSKKAIGNYLLSVEGELYAQKVVVTSSFADYVFDKSYKLKNLEEVENYIKEFKRLPNMPSSCDIEENGMNLADIVKLQMEKIEELTLHLIEHQKEISELKSLIKK